MRVISGIYKRRRFDVPTSFKARPTTDFAKENLFNVLQGYLDFSEEPYTALDLFAGTGSISVELVSRGCTKVVSVEREPLHQRFIQKVQQELRADNWWVLRGDVFKYVASAKEEFDFIFADPPYQLEELPQLPDLILSSSLLKPDGLFVLEHGKEHSFTQHPLLIDHRTYGSVNFSFFQKGE